MDRPAPVPDLDWAPDRAREFTGRMLDLWVELLERLPSLPAARGEPADAVSRAMAWPLPEQPLADEQIVELLRGLAPSRGRGRERGGPRATSLLICSRSCDC